MNAENSRNTLISNGARSGNRTRMALRPRDFKSHDYAQLIDSIAPQAVDKARFGLKCCTRAARVFCLFLGLFATPAMADTLMIRSGSQLTVWQGSFVDVDAQDDLVNIRFGSYTNSQLSTRDPLESPMAIEDTSIFVDGVEYGGCQLVRVKFRPGQGMTIKANC